MGDMENALWGADKGGVEQSINHSFVTAMLKGDTGKAPGHFALKGASAQAGPFLVGGLFILTPHLNTASCTKWSELSFGHQLR
jgi:hypothetical protein